MCLCSLTPISSEDDELALTGRQGRQQTGGDTYTLEIAFPAVKYVEPNSLSLSFTFNITINSAPDLQHYCTQLSHSD